MKQLKDLFEKAKCDVEDAAKDFKAVNKKEVDAKAAAYAAMVDAGEKAQILCALCDSGVTLDEIMLVIPAPTVEEPTKSKPKKKEAK
jgi:hypothetical protein